MKKIHVSLKERSYDILIGEGLLEKSGVMIRRLGIGSDAVIITNRTVSSLYGMTVEKSLRGSGITTRFELVPDSERAKSIRTLTAILNKIALYGRGRSIFIMALGGGVVGDLAGFIAAIYKRGVPYIQIPTTLLASVDSAIGGKTAVDLPIAKNMAGVFYQPRIVISDIRAMRSLGPGQIREALAEIIKYGIIKDPRLFEYIENAHRRIFAKDPDTLEFIIARCAAIKARIVEKDEFDRKGIRMVLNFGHTIGHAVEAASSYSKRFTHGEAVAVGMIAASRISSIMGLLDRRDEVRIARLIRDVGLPARIRKIDFPRIRDAYRLDKKFRPEANSFILPTRIGSVRIVNGVRDNVIRKAVMEVSR